MGSNDKVDQEDHETSVSIGPSVDDGPLPVSKLLMRTTRILIPTDISNLLWISSQTVTLAFVGRTLGEVCSAQYSAALVVFNVVGFSLALGLGGAIDTIASQAFGADPRSPMVGEVLQLALVLLLLLCIPTSLFFVYCEPVMRLIFSEEVAPGVAQFLRYSPPYLVVQVISGVMSKTLFAQKVPELVAVANLAAACTSPVSNYFLTPMGVHGASLSLFCTVASCCVVYALCCVFHPRVIVRCAPWPSPRLRSLTAWKDFMRVGLPSLLATCAEWWAFEVQTILASQISTVALTVQGICMNLTGFLFSVALGVCVAASVIVGNLLGSGRPMQAKQFASFIIVFDIVIGAVTALCMCLFGKPIAKMFVREDEVVETLTRIMPLVAVSHFGDSLQFCLQGIFKGAGKPKLAGIAVLATLWCVGVPASVILVTVVKVGVAGCICGLVIGFFFEIPLLYYLYTRFDWVALSIKAQRFNAEQDIVVEPLSPQADARAAGLVWPPPPTTFKEDVREGAIEEDLAGM